MNNTLNNKEGKTMIEITKKDERFEAVKFVAQAVSKDTTRPVLGVICSNGKRVLACDGMRVHSVKMQFPAGYYKVIVNNASKIILDSYDLEKELGRYPDIKAVWPRKAKNIIDVNKSNQHYLYGVSRVQVLTGKIIKKLDENVTINTGYAEDIINAMETFNVRQAGPTSALLFQNGTKRAIVMPIRMD